ncbi:hypothetical protein, partial [Caldithrix abyssi]
FFNLIGFDGANLRTGNSVDEINQAASNTASLRLLQGAGVRLLSVVEATVDCEGTFIGFAPFDFAQGAVGLLSPKPLNSFTLPVTYSLR